MAITTPVALATLRNTSNGAASYDITLSRAIASDEAVLVAVDLTGTSPPTTGTLTGAGLTWTEVASSIQAGVHRFYLFRGSGTPDSGTTLTFAHNDGAFSPTGCNADVVVIPGGDQTLPQAAATFVSTGASTGTATLGSTPASTSAGIGFATSAGSSSGTFSWAAHTALTNVNNTAPNMSMGSAYDLVSPPIDCTPTVSAGSNAFLVWYVEIAEAAGGAVSVTPGTASLTLATFAPTVTASDHKSVTPTTATLTTTGFAPTVTVAANQTVTPTTASLTLSAFAPTVTTTNNQLVTPAAISLVLTTFGPTVTASNHQSVTPGTASLTLTGLAPTVTASAHVTATPSTASLTLSPFAPTVTATAHVTVTPTTASLVISAFAPTITVAPEDVEGTVTLSDLAISVAVVLDTAFYEVTLIDEAYYAVELSDE